MSNDRSELATSFVSWEPIKPSVRVSLVRLEHRCKLVRGLDTISLSSTTFDIVAHNERIRLRVNDCHRQRYLLYKGRYEAM